LPGIVTKFNITGGVGEVVGNVAGRAGGLLFVEGLNFKIL
jgi:hypothetical protein